MTEYSNRLAKLATMLAFAYLVARIASGFIANGWAVTL